jgi:hypothetical protein
MELLVELLGQLPDLLLHQGQGLIVGLGAPQLLDSSRGVFERPGKKI